MAQADDQKYIVFKRNQFYELMGELALPPWTDADGSLLGGDIDCAPLAQHISERAEAVCLSDAVVIRRQDYLASPALASYAANIGMALHLIADPEVRSTLQAVADYFQRQSELAAEEGWKLPDL
jgi:hypothetical protein